MPRKKITFLVVPEDTSNVKEAKISRALVVVIACGILFFLGSFVFILKDYNRLKKSMPSRAALAREVTEQ